MHRGPTGEHVVGASLGGEVVRAFVPRSLPPAPALVIDSELSESMERALIALGRLDSVSNLLPDPDQFLYVYVRREAVLSSRIEGTQSSLSDLLLFELAEAPGVPVDDVREVSNYVAALDVGLKQLRSGLPISSRLLKEVHRALLRKGRGSEKEPGEFRRTQNWIGGPRPGVAAFVPPPPTRIAECMGDLEKFIHSDRLLGVKLSDPRLPLLVRIALAHVQFETIHPFLDGNGRVGRLLITLMLCAEGVLKEPLLYLSLYLKRNRTQYYDLLQAVRTTGEFEEWVKFFVAGVGETASEAVETARTLAGRFDKDQERVRKLGRVAGSALQVLFELRRRPVLAVSDLVRRTKLATPTVASVLETLGPRGLKIVREITGKKRGRAFAYAEYLKAMSTGE